MQPEACTELPQKLQVWCLPASQTVANHLFDAVATERQLQQFAEHLEAGQNFFQRSFAFDQFKASGWILLTKVEGTAQR